MEKLLELTLVFFKIGLFSIGGGYAVIPLIKEQVVERLGWISARTFTDMITISQMTPGPLAVNTSTFIGIRIGGIKGAVLSTGGCVISGILLSLLLYRFFRKRSGSTWVLRLLNGLKAGSLGLIMSAAGTILLLTLTGSDSVPAPGAKGLRIDPVAAALLVVSVFALRRWKVNPVLLMLLAGVAGLFAYG